MDKPEETGCTKDKPDTYDECCKPLVPTLKLIRERTRLNSWQYAQDPSMNRAAPNVMDSDLYVSHRRCYDALDFILGKLKDVPQKEHGELRHLLAETRKAVHAILGPDVLPSDVELFIYLTEGTLAHLVPEGLLDYAVACAQGYTPVTLPNGKRMWVHE